jgi:U3 small nucleolar RNA-associated protein 21
LIAIGNNKGELSIWSLETRKLLIKKNIHNEKIKTLDFLPNKPLLITASSDNSIKTFIFDREDKIREFNKIEGHSETPNNIKFYGDEGN